MKNTVTIIVIMMIIGVAILFRVATNDRREDLEVDNLERSQYTKLEGILKTYPELASSKITPDENYTSATIDGKYTVFIKTGNYMMTIKDEKDEETYCKIVDAIEISLGSLPTASLDTCHGTLDGTFSLGGISADIYENYKVLTVNASEPAKLYKKENTRREDELISVEELDYDVQVKDHTFTSIRTDYKEDTDNFSLCGNVYNEKNREDTLSVKLYDGAKNLIDSKDYLYTNETKKYIPFCLDFTMELNNVKYYSIGGK